MRDESGRDRGREGATLQVERHLNLIPFTETQRAHGFPGVTTSAKEFLAVEEQFNRRGISGPVPDIVSPGPITARRAVAAAEVKTGEQPFCFFSFPGFWERQAKTVVLASIWHVNPEFSGRELILKWTLRTFGDADDAVRPWIPWAGGRRIFRLQFEITTDPDEILQFLRKCRRVQVVRGACP